MQTINTLGSISATTTSAAPAMAASRTLGSGRLHGPCGDSASTRARARACAAALALALVWAAPGATLAADRGAGAECGLGILSVAATFFYGPAKIIYAGAGALTAGFAYALSGGQPDLSRSLLARSLRGDYVLTTEHLTGNRKIVFVGRDPDTEPYPY